MKRMTKGEIRKSIVCLGLALLMFSAVFIAPVGWGDDLDKAKENLSDVNQDIKDAQQEIKDNKKKLTQLTSDIKDLEQKIYASETELNILNIEMNELKAQIAVVLDELKALEESMAIQTGALETRLRTMYKNGDVGMLSVLLGSNSMTELITNMEMVKRVYDSDTEVMDSLIAQYDIVEAKRNELLRLKDQLAEKQKTAEAKKESLNTDKDNLEKKKVQVSNDNKELEAQVDALNKEAKDLKAKILKLQSSGKYAGGTMCWPSKSSTRITSSFGMRLHPILKVYKLHTGIDIGARSGTNILAANSGKVITASYSSGYGYYVMIDHGGGIVTVYAHSSKLLVSKGDKVKRGQVIALVGSTGMSTGAHLHFEVRLNGEYQQPLDYVTQGQYYYD